MIETDAQAQATTPTPALPYAVLVVLVIALQFGPAMGLAGYRLTGAAGWALVGLSRDVLAVALMLAALPALGRARAPLPASAWWALGMAAVYAALALVSDADLAALALNLRRLLLVPLLFAAVLLLPWSPGQVRALLRLLLATSVCVALVGIAERLAPASLWTDVLDVVGYSAANPLDPFGALPFEDSGRFFSWDLERWTGEPVRRAVSTYLEPTTLAAAMAAAWALALAQRARGVDVGGAAWWLALCGALTLAKSFGLFALLLAAWRVCGVPSPRQAVLLTLAAAGIALAAGDLGRLDGPLAHIAGLASSLHYLAEGHWLGEGMGRAGNYAASLSVLGEDGEVGTESGLGNAITQVGVAGLLPLLWVHGLAGDVLDKAARLRDAGGAWLASWLLFWLMSFLFSASSLGVGGNALGFIMLALYLHPACRPMAAQRRRA